MSSQFLSNNSKQSKTKVTKATFESILKQVMKQANKQKIRNSKHQNTNKHTQPLKHIYEKLVNIISKFYAGKLIACVKNRSRFRAYREQQQRVYLGKKANKQTKNKKLYLYKYWRASSGNERKKKHSNPFVTTSGEATFYADISFNKKQ